MVVFVACGSPVSDDSLTSRFSDSSSSQSAGTSSPVSTMTMSPTTMSRRATWLTLSLRMTFTGVSSFTLLRLWKVFSLLRSRK